MDGHIRARDELVAPVGEGAGEGAAQVAANGVDLVGAGQAGVGGLEGRSHPAQRHDAALPAEEAELEHPGVAAGHPEALVVVRIGRGQGAHFDLRERREHARHRGGVGFMAVHRPFTGDPRHLDLPVVDPLKVAPLQGALVDALQLRRQLQRSGRQAPQCPGRPARRMTPYRTSSPASAMTSLCSAFLLMRPSRSSGARRGTACP